VTRTLATVLALGAVFWPRGAERAAEANPPREITSPSTAVRVHPGPVAPRLPVASDLTTLRAEVSRLIQGTGLTSEWGVLAVSLEHGDTLMALNADRALAPASNQKILVTAAALHYLGPDHRFPTFLLTDGEIRDGVLHGDLILYGTGDPAISDQLLPSETAVWEEFADSLRKAGVHTVTGGVVGDESFFQGPSRAPSWSDGYLDDWYAAPVSALTFAENVVTLRISGGVVGAPARVGTMPEGAMLPLQNTSVTVAGAEAGGLRVGREDPDGPIEIRGQMGNGARESWRILTVSDPATYAASVFRSVLVASGIRVEGSVSRNRSEQSSRLTESRTIAPGFQGREGSRPLRTLAVHYSPPLSELLKILNKQSHNLYAELFLFAVGRMTGGEGSFAGGSAALGSYLSRVVGVSTVDFNIEDGSGLSRLNRATPATFVKVLRSVSQSEHADVFWASMPEAGNRRELARMYQSPAAGNLRAKTGTISRVSALSGIVRTADGEPVLFSILANNLPSSRAKRVEDAIGIELASLTRSPIVGD
jgi:D-alanyl-D-alanine carboxypeptidase/D-alanyl-D-alanine-endopeptidase (penicillin-binding protein 4)